MIENWDTRDFSLDVIVYCIQHRDDKKPANETEEKELKRHNLAWKFLDFLLIYFNQNGFDGKEFIAKNVQLEKSNESQQQKSTGFGLTLIKEVCTQFKQRTGQYTKVKKLLSEWAKKRLQRYQNEQKFSLDGLKVFARKNALDLFIYLVCDE